MKSPSSAVDVGAFKCGLKNVPEMKVTETKAIWQSGRTGVANSSNDSRYPGSSRLLHWLVAVLVLLTWPLGLVIGFTRQEVQLQFYLLHESLGFLLLWLMLVRVGNKLVSGAPEVEGSAIKQFAAASVHGLLYVFLIVMPVSGFLATNAHGFPLKWFGIVEIWSPLGKSPDFAWTLSEIHSWSAWVLLGLFGLHLVAVLFHHIVRQDRTLYRIL